MTTLTLQAVDTIAARLTQSIALLSGISSSLLEKADDPQAQLLASQIWAVETLLEQAQAATEDTE